MEQYLCIGSLIIFVLIAFVLQQQQKKTATQQIYGYIQQQGGTVSELTPAHDFDRDTMTFIVSYYDWHGYYQRTRCKMRYRNFLSGNNRELYWTHDPAVDTFTHDKLADQVRPHTEPAPAQKPQTFLPKSKLSPT